MSKIILVILLILSFYIYTSITPISRGDINHNVALIPHHIGNVIESVANRITDIQNDYHTEKGIDNS